MLLLSVYFFFSVKFAFISVCIHEHLHWVISSGSLQWCADSSFTELTFYNCRSPTSLAILFVFRGFDLVIDWWLLSVPLALHFMSPFLGTDVFNITVEGREMFLTPLSAPSPAQKGRKTTASHDVLLLVEGNRITGTKKIEHQEIFQLLLRLFCHCGQMMNDSSCQILALELV